MQNGVLVTAGGERTTGVIEETGSVTETGSGNAIPTGTEVGTTIAAGTRTGTWTGHVTEMAPGSTGLEMTSTDPLAGESL